MIEYRPARTADAEAIPLHHARGWRETYRGSFHDAFLDGDLPGERLRVWGARLDRPDPSQFVQVAMDASVLAGFVCAYGAHDPRWGSLIDNLHVDPAFQRKGIASALMEQSGAWLADRYADLAVYLLVLEVNESARLFYERLGGRNAGASTMETHGGALVRSCRYVWELPRRLSSA